MHIPRKHAKRARIEIIPMIDAIFFLLVFFMFSSLSMVKMKAMALSVPRPSPVRADSARAHKPGLKLVLTVDTAGKYSLNDAALAPADLVPRIQEQVTAHPDAMLILNIDKRQTAQHLIDAMDALNKVVWPTGSKPRVLIATEPVDSKGRPIAAKGGAR